MACFHDTKFKMWHWLILSLRNTLRACYQNSPVLTQTILSEVDFFGHDNCLMSKSIDSVLNMMFLKSKEYREKSKFMQVRNAID